MASSYAPSEDTGSEQKTRGKLRKMRWAMNISLRDQEKKEVLQLRELRA